VLGVAAHLFRQRLKALRGRDDFWAAAGLGGHRCKAGVSHRGGQSGDFGAHVLAQFGPSAPHRAEPGLQGPRKADDAFPLRSSGGGGPPGGSARPDGFTRPNRSPSNPKPVWPDTLITSSTRAITEVAIGHHDGRRHRQNTTPRPRRPLMCSRALRKALGITGEPVRIFRARGRRPPDTPLSTPTLRPFRCRTTSAACLAGAGRGPALVGVAAGRLIHHAAGSVCHQVSMIAGSGHCPINLRYQISFGVVGSPTFPGCASCPMIR